MESAVLILIPTKGRATRQTTLACLPPRIFERTYLLVENSQVPGYEAVVYRHKLLVAEATNIAPCRQWALEYAHRSGVKKLIMLDDDLVFAKRREDDPTKFHNTVDKDMENLFEDIERLLDKYAHVGVSPREGGNRRTEPYIENTRIMRVLAYRVDVLMQEKLRFDDAELMEDFMMSLNLLTRGYATYSINWMVQNQNGSDLPGGCSTFRTPHMQEAAARKLAATFPDFVKVVNKETKTAWGGQARVDVTVQWKKAYNSSKDKKSL